MPRYSIIIPVYNRPEEVDELLASLEKQSFLDFEVIIVEDGSELDCRAVCDKYKGKLDLSYHYKENTGQGFSRNFGSKLAKGDWLIFFDSDCVIPEQYLSNLDKIITDSDPDALCGPDASHKDFSTLQKAISYSMTSFLTTGGIRGRKLKVDKEAHLRSYNLVINKKVFFALDGFKKTNMGEDMELSKRFQMKGYRSVISSDLVVYHKRRDNLVSFSKQIYSFGRTRTQLFKDYRVSIKLPHLFPSVFTIGILVTFLLILFNSLLGSFLAWGYSFYFLLILVHASFMHLSLKVGLFSVFATLIQHTSYGIGLIHEFFRK
ncbi:Glycosyltransferase, catalytic subunit of cellulose synthase and poly-beta-1,6-N-acetylglucosamine synthase [Ekhidna lutea]|uniref:Glycosyltransferase, catalytic subunit of cellulose synthase and poly-beta-1,6-N-acetylglucosamine synthase n=1 Tax=Ekhidna lutea TaxID=447679 RepID=A0A239K973_EKHLU|nr:glycosyltransferase [Ekhidna lutea]SNT13714.1 Glycosyltransferase, catalytic subunit of cellulose synthase and poly-beta-1,6-N-acetylglucosamine synthase [Ekhidna lutea]